MHVTKNDALQKLDSKSHLFTNLFKHGTLELEVYKPYKEDLQKPHNRDEVYIII